MSILVGLDVGTTKVCTVIGELSSDGILDILAESNVPSQGLKHGAVINLERTSEAIRQSLFQAERIAGVKAERVYVGIAGPHIRSETSPGLAAIRRGNVITVDDVDRAIEQAKAVPFEGDLELIHALPLDFKVDNQEGIRDPVGMAGVRLEVNVHLVASPRGPLANLRKAVEDAGLEVAGIALQSYASGMAVLTPEETMGSVMLIDIGSSTTDVAVFRGGRLAHSAVISLGGNSITKDISDLLRIPFDEAERVKKKYGAALPELADPELVLEINQEPMNAIPAPELARIIRPRVHQDMLQLARASVEQHLGPLELTVEKVVLTGGTAMLKGIEELTRAAYHYRIPVRLGKPVGISGLVDVVASPTHATAVGLVRYAALLEMQTARAAPPRTATRPARATRETPANPTQENIWFRVRRLFKDFF